MTAAKPHNLKPTACWKSSDVAGLDRTWLPSIEIVELPEDRWSVSLYSKDIEENVGGCVFPTRAAAIRSEVAAAIRHARDLVAERRSGIETVFSITDDQFRTYVAWLRGIAAEEASRKRAKIESFERGCRRATDWIADREIELGVAGMHPNAPGYPAQLTKAWAKYIEFQAALAKLKAPIAAPVPEKIQFDEADVVAGEMNEIDGSIERALAQFNEPTLQSVRGLGKRLVDIRSGVKNLIEESEAGVRVYDPADPRYPRIAAAARPRLARLDQMTRDADCREYDLEKLEREAVLVAETPKPARKSRRGAPDPLTDVDRATSIVMRALKAIVRPGAPLPILRVVAAQLTGATDGAEAEVTMFDGLSARFECERYGPEPDAWKTRWSRMEGGDIELVDGGWRRVETERAAA